MSWQTRSLDRKGNAVETAEKFRRLVEGWMPEDAAYDGEAWPELGDGLDRNRLEYRKHFPDEDRSKAAESQVAPPEVQKSSC